MIRRILDWLTDAATWTRGIITGRGQGHGVHVLPAIERPEPQHDDVAEVTGPPPMPLPYHDYLRPHIEAAHAAAGVTRADVWKLTAPPAAIAAEPVHETAVDVSLLAAIRAEIDGTEHLHQYVDRLFAQIDIRQIFDRALAGVTP